MSQLKIEMEQNHSFPLTAGSTLAHRSALSALSTMSSKTEKADVAKAGEDLEAYLEFLGKLSAQDQQISISGLKAVGTHVTTVLDGIYLECMAKLQAM